MNDMMASPVHEFRFDDGIGSQRVTNHEMRELKKTAIILEAEIDSLMNRLCGMGVVNMSLVRRG